MQPGPEEFPAGCFSSSGRSAPEEELKPRRCVRTGPRSGAASPSHGSAEQKENVGTIGFDGCRNYGSNDG